MRTADRVARHLVSKYEPCYDNRCSRPVIPSTPLAGPETASLRPPSVTFAFSKRELVSERRIRSVRRVRRIDFSWPRPFDSAPTVRPDGIPRIVPTTAICRLRRINRIHGRYLQRRARKEVRGAIASIKLVITSGRPLSPSRTRVVRTNFRWIDVRRRNGRSKGRTACNWRETPLDTRQPNHSLSDKLVRPRCSNASQFRLLRRLLGLRKLDGISRKIRFETRSIRLLSPALSSIYPTGLYCVRLTLSVALVIIPRFCESATRLFSRARERLCPSPLRRCRVLLLSLSLFFSMSDRFARC